MGTYSNDYFNITSEDLYEIFLIKHGSPEKTGWKPCLRLHFGYYQSADYYEALVNKCVCDKTKWLDVGCGKWLFSPSNIRLAEILSQRAGFVVGVDSSDNIDNNPFVHERVKCLIEDYETEHLFDLVTLRMVVEHIANPTRLVESLSRLVKQGGIVIVFTVNLWSPSAMVSKLLPFKLHYPIKRILWKEEEEKDTFPTFYQLNTRKQLRTFFREDVFEERLFTYLDELSIFGQSKFLSYAELLLWRVFKKMGLHYPENCFLAVYEKL